MSGTIIKIHANQAIQIMNSKGLQLLLYLKKKNNSVPDDKIFQCEVSEGDKVKKGDNLITIFVDNHILSVVVSIPWQPFIIDEIKNINEYGFFAKVYYCNPLIKKRIKNHAMY